MLAKKKAFENKAVALFKHILRILLWKAAYQTPKIIEKAGMFVLILQLKLEAMPMKYISGCSVILCLFLYFLYRFIPHCDFSFGYSQKHHESSKIFYIFKEQIPFLFVIYDYVLRCTYAFFIMS